MKPRFILFRRAGVFYSEDTTTRKQCSLRTKDEAEALTLLHSKNEAHRQPGGVIGSVIGEPLGAKEQGLVVRAYMVHCDGRRLTGLACAVAEGKLVIPIAKKFPLAEIREAQTLAERGAGGKVVLLVR